MPTKVFISWSGDLSKSLAEALREWLPNVLQFVTPYFTPEDTEKGTRWDPEIAGELESSDIGIICLTKNNTQSPWLLFEAGALSKRLDKSRVCTVLFDGLEWTDLKGPLTMFQHTKFEREDFKKLVTSVNNAEGETKLKESTLNTVFEKWWPDLEARVQTVLTDHPDESPQDIRTDRDLLEEILALTRQAGHGETFSERLTRLMETKQPQQKVPKPPNPAEVAFKLMLEKGLNARESES